MRAVTLLDTPYRADALIEIAVPAFVTGILVWLSSQEVSVAQGTMAFLLCWMPWRSYRKWLGTDRKNIPLFALLATMFFLSYAVPLFWADHVVTGIFGRRVLPESAVTAALWLAVMGVACLWLGMRVAQLFHWVPKIQKDVADNPSRWTYLRVVFIVGAMVKIFVPITALGIGGRQFVSSFENTVPVVTFAIFARHYLRGTLGRTDKILVAGYAAVAIVAGISSGWLGSAVSLGMVFIVIYVYERRRFPLTAAMMVLPIILFFQPAKTMFRERYWAKESTDSTSERVTYWVENSWRLWSDAITSHDNKQLRELSNSTLSRFDLLRQTAHVIEFTPGRVPYQYGSLYSYMGVTFIPRYFWPDKPSVNDANRWYQVRYGLTNPGNLYSVSIAVGTVAESYINFGWLGPVLVIIPLGIFLGTFERIFLHGDSGVLFSCLGAVLVPQLVSIESQMAQYVAGLAQQIVLILLVLLPTLEARSPGRQVLRFQRVALSPDQRRRPANSKPPATAIRGIVGK